MKIINLVLISIIFIFLLAIVVPVDSERTLTSGLSYPAEGTMLTYNNTWTQASLVGIYNSTHIDFSKHPSADFTVEYPISAQYTVSFQFYDKFLEETVEGTVTNHSNSFYFKRSFLINITTRLHVNEEGHASEMYTFRYIDPNNVSLGQKLPLETRLANVTASTTINIAGTELNAWKLEDLELNLTSYYDVSTGIFLEGYNWGRNGSVLSHLWLISWKRPTPQITSFSSLMVVVIGFLLLMMTRKHGL